MKKIYTMSALIFSLWALSGCLFDSGVEWKDEKYHVGWIDDGNNTLYCTIDNGGPMKVRSTIISVGSNNLFVVAKRQPEGGLIQYYYIEKRPDRSFSCVSDRTHGPFDAVRFSALTEELNLPLFEKNFE